MSSVRESSLIRTMAFALSLLLTMLVLGEAISSDNSDISFLVIERLEDSKVYFASSLLGSLSCDMHAVFVEITPI